MTAADSLEFKGIRLGARPLVHVDSSGFRYEQPQLLTKSSKSVEIPRQMITSVDVAKVRATPTDIVIGRVMLAAELTVRSAAETVTVRTDVATAETARRILLAAAPSSNG